MHAKIIEIIILFTAETIVILEPPCYLANYKPTLGGVEVSNVSVNKNASKHNFCITECTPTNYHGVR